MKSLQTIQKTFRIFQTLTKVMMVLSFVWAGLAALGLLCGIVWYNGGSVFGADQALLLALKPFLRKERQEKIDRALHAARLASLASLALKNRGRGPGAKEKP